MKKAIATVIAVILLTLTGCDPFFDWQYSGMSHYAHDRNYYAHASEVLPEENTVKDYITINYTYQHTPGKGTEFSSGLALFVKYNTDTFGEWSREITSRYTYLEGDDERYPGLPYCDFTFRGYDMKIVPVCEGDDACRYFGIVGVYASKNKLCILFFSDEDFKGIDPEDGDLEAAYCELIENSFYWR